MVKYIIICDENTSEHCLSHLLFSCHLLTTAEIIELESGEKNKTIETCIQFYNRCSNHIDKYPDTHLCQGTLSRELQCRLCIDTGSTGN